MKDWMIWNRLKKTEIGKTFENEVRKLFLKSKEKNFEGVARGLESGHANNVKDTSYLKDEEWDIDHQPPGRNCTSHHPLDL